MEAKDELKENKQALANTKAELEESKQALANTKAELEATRVELFEQHETHQDRMFEQGNTLHQSLLDSRAEVARLRNVCQQSLIESWAPTKKRRLRERK